MIIFMEMMAIVLALFIPYLMVKVQPNGFVAQIVFSLSLIINGMAVFLTGITLSYDLLFRPILEISSQSCRELCTWTMADPMSATAFVFLVVMCLGGIGMLYTAIIDRKYNPDA